MKHYFCKSCCYTTNHKNKFFRHLKTEKHILNEKNIGVDNIKTETNTEKVSNPSLYLLPNPPSSLYLPKGQKRAIDKNILSKSFEKSESDEFICQFCEKKFTRIDNLTRHHEKSCRILKIMRAENQNKINELEKENNKNKLIIQQKIWKKRNLLRK